MMECMLGEWSAAALAELTAAGGYFALWKIIVMLIMLLPLFYLAPLVQKDAQRILAPHKVWSMVVLGAGALGVLIWLLLPLYLLGLILYVVLTTAVFGSYAVYHNRKVPDHAKILTAEHLSGLFKGRRKEKIAVVTKLKLYNSDGKIALPPPQEETPVEDILGYNAAQELLYDAIWCRASEADVSPAGAESRVRFVIDGVVTDRSPLPLADSEALIQFLKPIAGMNPQELRRPQNGKVSVDLANKPIDIDLIATGTTGGQRLRLRIVQEVVQTNLDMLGIPEDLLEHIRRINLADTGLVIVSSRPSNGMTSTLYSLLRGQDAFIKQLVTLEAKPAVDLENVTQNAYDEVAKQPAMLASVLRRDPDVVMVDTCSDRKTAELILEATGRKKILLGMHGLDSFTALARWIKVVGDRGRAVQGLQAVLCQVLIRKLCPTCKEGYRPAANLLAKINLPADQIDQFYRPPTSPLTDEKGRPYVCATCQGSGYFGRTAAFELLEMTDDVRELVAGGASVRQIKGACRKNKMLYLQEQALRHVMAGLTSIEEVIRISRQSKKQPAK